LQEAIDEENRNYPQKLSECLVMKETYLDGEYVMYLIECDEDLLDMGWMNNPKSETKNNMRHQLKSAPEIKQFINICKKAHKGIGYKYQGDTICETCAV